MKINATHWYYPICHYCFAIDMNCTLIVARVKGISIRIRDGFTETTYCFLHYGRDCHIESINVFDADDMEYALEMQKVWGFRSSGLHNGVMEYVSSIVGKTTDARGFATPIEEWRP